MILFWILWCLWCFYFFRILIFMTFLILSKILNFLILSKYSKYLNLYAWFWVILLNEASLILETSGPTKPEYTLAGQRCWCWWECYIWQVLTLDLKTGHSWPELTHQHKFQNGWETWAPDSISTSSGAPELTSGLGWGYTYSHLRLGCGRQPIIMKLTSQHDKPPLSEILSDLVNL